MFLEMVNLSSLHQTNLVPLILPKSLEENKENGWIHLTSPAPFFKCSKCSKLDTVLQLNTTPAQENFMYIADKGPFFLYSPVQCLHFCLSITHIHYNFQIFSMTCMLFQLFPGLWVLECRFSLLGVGVFLTNSHSILFSSSSLRYRV